MTSTAPSGVGRVELVRIGPRWSGEDSDGWWEPAPASPLLPSVV
jgi:hypothetical protein